MDSHGSDRGRLDASGPREVVFCHQCEHDWYRDESGLICPNCDGEITEIVSPTSDPRPGVSPPSPENSEIRDFDHHYPWASAGIPDPDEEDIEEHMQQGREDSSQWDYARPGHPRRQERQPQEDPSNVIRDFQSMISSLMGPNLQMGQPGRSGPDALFSREDGITRNTYISNGPNGSAQVTRITYRSPNILRPRNAGTPQAQGQRVDDISLVLGNLFNAMGPMAAMQHGHDHEGGARGPPQAFPLGGLFSQLFNPANAAAGDAVFTQEALDRVISDLMENHQTSNAPGPASPEAIARLPKKKLDTKMLGGDAKGECSVCMDDVHAGDEVVELPCRHWFHEACVGAWLGEHNTCPICRKGLEGESPNATSPQTSRQPSFSSNPNLSPSAFEIQNQARLAVVRERSEARLNSIRERSGTSFDSSPSNRYISGGSRSGARSPSPPPAMPGNFADSESYGDSGRSSSFRRRDSTLSEGQSSSRNRRSGSESGGGGGGGVTGWIRDRFSGRRE